MWKSQKIRAYWNTPTSPSGTPLSKSIKTFTWKKICLITVCCIWTIEVEVIVRESTEMYFKLLSSCSPQAERHGMGVHHGSSWGNGGSSGAIQFWDSHLASKFYLRRSSYPEWNLCLLPPWDAEYSTSWYHPRHWGKVSLACLQDVLLTSPSMETLFFGVYRQILSLFFSKAVCRTCW